MKLSTTRTALQVTLVAAAFAASAATAIALAQDTTKTKNTQKTQDTHKPTTTTTTPPQGELPPGMTAEDMQAMMTAATPGPMQAWLCEDEGVWEGTCCMWMAPGTEPNKSPSTFTVTPILGGRFIRQDAKGDMGEWGPFEGTGMIGYDNAKGEFQSSWADCMGTGMMCGTGNLSSDQKVLTINYSYYCPIAKKVLPFKQTITRNDDGTRTMRMWGSPPGGGDMFKIMETAYTRTTPHHKHTDAKHADAETKSNDKHNHN